MAPKKKCDFKTRRPSRALLGVEPISSIGEPLAGVCPLVGPHDAYLQLAGVILQFGWRIVDAQKQSPGLRKFQFAPQPDLAQLDEFEEEVRSRLRPNTAAQERLAAIRNDVAQLRR